MQMILREKHTDELAGMRSFIKGKSTANERIEKHWGHFRHHTAGFYIELFKEMERNLVLDSSDPMHIECLRYCFGHLIRNSAARATKEWNEHRIRTQKNKDAPDGIPNVIYNWPERYGGVEYKKSVDLKDVEKLMPFSVEPKLYEKETELLFTSLMPGISIPSSPKKAYNLFIKLTAMLKSAGILLCHFLNMMVSSML